MHLSAFPFPPYFRTIFAKPTCTLFFVCIILLPMIIKNVIAAIIVNEHTSQANDDRWEQQEAENMRQLQLIQEEIRKGIEGDFGSVDDLQAWGDNAGDEHRGVLHREVSTTTCSSIASKGIKKGCWPCYFAVCRKHSSVSAVSSEAAVYSALEIMKVKIGVTQNLVK